MEFKSLLLKDYTFLENVWICLKHTLRIILKYSYMFLSVSFLFLLEEMYVIITYCA